MISVRVVSSAASVASVTRVLKGRSVNVLLYYVYTLKSTYLLYFTFTLLVTSLLLYYTTILLQTCYFSIQGVIHWLKQK